MPTTSKTESPWGLQAALEGHSDDKNDGGLVIYVTNSSGSRTEIGRVAFERTEAINKFVTFETQVDTELAKARKAIQVLNDLAKGAGTLA